MLLREAALMPWDDKRDVYLSLNVTNNLYLQAKFPRLMRQIFHIEDRNSKEQTKIQIMKKNNITNISEERNYKPDQIAFKCRN